MTTSSQTKKVSLGDSIRGDFVSKNAFMREITEESSKGFRIVTLYTVTNPSLYKTNNPFWDKENQEWTIRKESHIQGFIYANPQTYQKAVNAELNRQGLPSNFVAKQRTWGNRINNSCLIQHTRKDGIQKMYLEIRPHKTLEYRFIHAANYQPLNSNEITELKQFEIPNKPDFNQGLDSNSKILVRDYDIDNIVGISFGGNPFRLIH